MNQILITNQDNNSNNGNSNYRKSNNTDMKKIITFFGIVILIFGIAIIGVYGYKTYRNKNANKQQELKPQLSLEETEEYLTIIAKSNVGLSKMIYSWNDEEPQESDLFGRTSQEERIKIPNGENNFTVKIIDVNGEEIESEKTIYKESTDFEKPIIETAIVENAQLKITATDETEIKFITYKWNDEEEEMVEAENEGDTTIETNIDVKRGENTLTIKAVDSSDNETIIEKPIKGVNKPEISVKKKGSKLIMYITHDMGFKEIEFSINGKIYTYNEEYSEYDETLTEQEFEVDLEPGETIVIIRAVSTEDTEETYKGKCTYTPDTTNE